MKRIFAIILLLILIFSLFATVYVAIFTSNTKLLFVFLFIDIVMPVIVYAYIIITKQKKDPEIKSIFSNLSESSWGLKERCFSRSITKGDIACFSVSS